MDVTKLFERGSQAFERGNWQLSIIVWQQLLAIEPDDIKARKLLRTAQARKWAGEGKGNFAKAMAIAKSLAPIATFAFHMLRKNYGQAMISCEKALTHDPTSMQMLSGLVTAATKGEHTEVALVTLEYMRTMHPQNVGVLRHLALLYEEQNDVNRSIETWENLKSIIPDDREADTKLRNLTAIKAMTDGKYHTATGKDTTYRESLKDKEEAEDLEQEHRIIRTEDDLQRAIERVTKDVRDNPNQKRYIIQLGDLYAKAMNFAKARELYQQARELDQMDFSIAERLGDLQIDEYTEKERTLAQKIADDPNDAAAKAALEALHKEKFEYSVNEYKRQVGVRPTDAALRAKLGDLLFNAKMYEQAASEYQKAATDPRVRRRCKKLFGLCLFNTGKYQLAISQFEQASEGSSTATRETREILYYMALTYEKLGNLDRSEETLRKIFDADMSYKDVQKRLDDITRVKRQQQTIPSPSPQSGEKT